MQNNTNLFKRQGESAPKELVADRMVALYPKSSERIKVLIQKVPLTSQVMFDYKQQKGISKEWKCWALEMLENGMETPGIVQLAGEDLNMNIFEFNSLVCNIFQELGIDLSNDDAYYQYALSIAHQVVNGEISSEKGFEILSSVACHTGYNDAFMNFYYINDDADLMRDGYSAFNGDGSMRKDNIEEWMYQYFEKLIKINE
jgi:hypothetical protein